MAFDATSNPTLLDLQQRLDPDGSVADVTEILNETSEVLQEMTWQEGNLDTGNKTTVRTGIPLPTWRKMYGGVQRTKSTTAQVTDTCGMLEAYAEVDKALVDLAGRREEFRLSEEMPHIEGFNQRLSETIFYGDSSINPERFTGLAPRYSQLTGAENSENVIDGGGTGSDNASIWLVTWSPQTCFGIVPKNSQIGLQINDHGEVTVENADGANGRMQAYRTHYRWDCGLCLKDWRYVVRICNIDRSALTKDASSGANLPDLMFEAMERIPEGGAGGRMSFYMDRSTRTKLRQQMAYGVSNSTLEYTELGGRKVMSFQDIGIRRVDKLAVDEAAVT